MLEILSHPLVGKYNDIPRFIDLADFKSYLQSDLDLWYQEEGGRWAIEYNKTVIGSCGIYNYAHDINQGEIGFELHPDYWQLGLMAEALVALLDYYRSANSIPRLMTLVARCHKDNTASLKLLNKLKFIKSENEIISYQLKL